MTVLKNDNMKKNDYLKELTIASTQKRNGTSNKKSEVIKIQSWLSLFSDWNPNSGTATNIDGSFGPATERAVKNFQTFNSLSDTGIVDQSVFSELSKNIKDAFERPLLSNNLRDLVVEVAENHLKNHPRELKIGGEDNSGPWVRSYMDGNDGALWFWCMGFVQTIIDQAASKRGKSITSLMPLSVSCDTVGNAALRKGLLTRFQKLRKDSSIIKKGDIFLSHRSPKDWTHTGIITAVFGDVIETIEGNTNVHGSRNGIAVMKRTRNIKKSKIDVFSIEPLV